MVSRGAAELPRARLPGTRRRHRGHPPRLGAARAGGGQLGRAAGPDGTDRRRAAHPGGGGGRPGGRLSAQRARDGGGVPGLPQHRRRVGLGRPGVRRALGGRSLRPDRAQGPAGHRRLPLRRTRLRPRRRGAQHRRGHPIAAAGGHPGLSRRQRLARGLHRGRRRARPPGLRAGCLRSPALGAVQLGHHRSAQGDRPTARAASCSSI